MFICVFTWVSYWSSLQWTGPQTGKRPSWHLVLIKFPDIRYSQRSTDSDHHFRLSSEGVTPPLPDMNDFQAVKGFIWLKVASLPQKSISGLHVAECCYYQQIILLMLLHRGHSLLASVIKSFSGPRGVNGVDRLIDYSQISCEIVSLTARSHTPVGDQTPLLDIRSWTSGVGNQESVIGHLWWMLEEALGSCMTEMSV